MGRWDPPTRSSDQNRPLGWCDRCGGLSFKDIIERNKGYCDYCRHWRKKWINRRYDSYAEFYDNILFFMPKELRVPFSVCLNVAYVSIVITVLAS